MKHGFLVVIFLLLCSTVALAGSGYGPQFNYGNASGGASALDDLTDVDDTGVTDEYILIYDADTAIWYASASAGVTTITGLTDTSVGSVADADLLSYDANTSLWFSSSLSEVAVDSNSSINLGGTIAGGQQNVVLGDGAYTTADNSYTTIIGEDAYSSTATTNAYVTIIGNGAYSSYPNSLVVGAGAANTASAGTVLGRGATVSANAGTAVGYYTVADQAGCVAIGVDSGYAPANCDATNQIMLGTSNHFADVPSGDLELNAIRFASGGYAYDIRENELDIALGSGTSTHTLTAAMKGMTINYTSSDTTIIVPDSTFSDGDKVRINMDSDALVYISAGSGISTDDVIATDATPQLREKGSSAVIEFRAADSYRITGDLVQN